MSRVRLMLLAGLAALVVTAIGASAASAETCKKHGVEPHEAVYCIEFNNEARDGQMGKTGVDEGGGEPEFTVSGNTFKLKTTAGSPTIQCTKVEGNGVIVQKNSELNGHDSIEKLLFTGCTVVGNTKCTVQDSSLKKIGEIEVREIDSELVLVGGVIYNLLYNSEVRGGTFVTLEIKNKGAETCLVAGTYEVTGEAAGQTTETAKAPAPLKFSKAIQEAAKVTNAFKLKGVGAWLEGESTQAFVNKSKASVENELTGKLEEIELLSTTKWSAIQS